MQPPVYPEVRVAPHTHEQVDVDGVDGSGLVTYDAKADLNMGGHVVQISGGKLIPYYAGMAMIGPTSGTDTPLWGVLNSAQSGEGVGAVALTVTDSNEVDTFNNVLDDGSGNMTLAGELDMGTHPIIGVVDPTNAQDAATKHYVDSAVSGAGSGMTNPMTTLGDLIYENATPAPTRLAGNTTSTKKFLVQTGTGSVSAAPAWGTIATSDVPTLNQNTTGSAATATVLATARAIDGQNFDGSAAITVIAPGTHAATSKATPVDADELPIVDSAASNVLKKLTWANLKATLKTYFDTLYQAAGSYITASSTDTLTNKNLTSGTNTFPTLNQNTTGSAAKLTTPRAINGVNFDGSAAITVADSTKAATANNLSDLASAATARTNLGLGTAATMVGPAGTILGTTDTQTETNKRITRRHSTVTQAAAPAINTDNMDVAQITGLAQAITSMTTNLTGTPVDTDLLEIQITDNGTARAIAWGTSFASTSNATLPLTTVLSTKLRVLVEWDATASKWVCLAVT